MRRGSSWPILIETEAGPYITKLSGSGHGSAALVAEILVAALADQIGLRVPQRALIRIDRELDSENRDPELLELLEASQGLNVGFEYLSDARDVRAADYERISGDDAAIIIWLDWLVMNPDRTPRNPNLLMRDGELWLIDHGAALIFQHDWAAVTEDSPARSWFPPARHALGGQALELQEWDALLRSRIDREMIRAAVNEVPDDFLLPLLPRKAVPDALARRREAYVAFLWKRLKSARFET